MLSLLIPVLVNVAFLTLLERKILGYGQSRKGPNKVRVYGVLQPIADAVKLFTKEAQNPGKRNPVIFLAAPTCAIGIMLLVTISLRWRNLDMDFSLIYLFLFLGLGLYPLLLAGWASNSSYATIGGLRGVAQTISYEVRLALILVSYFTLFGGLRINSLAELGGWGLFFFTCPLLGLWLLTGLAETNRTPFDFAEGERELVSGFNVEFGGGSFAIIFMAEYGIILFFRVVRARLCGVRLRTGVIGILAVAVVCFFWVWTRTTLPRHRYDKLILLAWKIILPISLSVLALYIII